MKNLLLTTDLSDIARRAYAAAASIAKKFDATIHLVHELESMPALLEAVNVEQILKGYHNSLMEKLEREIRDANLQGVRVKTAIVGNGLDIETIEDFVKSQDIDLVVMSTHGRTGFSHALVGSFTERVTRHSTAPVLVYRRQESEVDAFAPHSILVPIDFSENAKTVFPILRDLSEKFNSEVKLLHVFPEVPTRGNWEDTQQKLRVSAQQASAMEDELRSLGQSELSGRKVTINTRYGDAYAEIMRESRHAPPDLIVMATHGWTGLKRLYFGSVTEKVMRTGLSSVLTVRPNEMR